MEQYKTLAAVLLGNLWTSFDTNTEIHTYVMNLNFAFYIQKDCQELWYKAQ